MGNARNLITDEIYEGALELLGEYIPEELADEGLINHIDLLRNTLGVDGYTLDLIEHLCWAIRRERKNNENV